MTLTDMMRLAWGALRAHGVRTRLTAAALSIGVASVLVLVGLGEGARRWIVSRFETLGSAVLVVLPGKTETRGGPPLAPSTTRDLTLDDMNVVARRVPEVRRTIPIVVGEASARFRGRGRAATVVGTTRAFLELRDLAVRQGENLPDLESDRAAPVCVIGRSIQRDLFPLSNPLGERIRLGEYAFRVVGVLAEEGQSMAMDLDDVVLIPVASGLRIFNRRGLFRMLVQVRAPSELARAEERVKALIMERHDDEEDFTILTPGAVAKSLGSIIGILTAALAAIAAVSLTVAGIGVMNVMIVSVRERTKEVGLMKAVGAGNGQVASVFLAEALILSLMGGLLGVGAGYGLTGLARLIYPEIPFQVPVAWSLATFGVAGGVGLLFGTLPAARAARLHPVDALRGRM